MLQATIGSRSFDLLSRSEQRFAEFREGTVGVSHPYLTAYGQKRMIYADWAASGRLYAPIEAAIVSKLGPFIANTHTESNMTGTVTTHAYEEAKHIIKRHVQADEHDLLLLAGSGMTAAVNKVQRLLGLRAPEQLQGRLVLAEHERPVIFVTHMEHHSNQISWSETIGDVICIRPTASGDVDLDHLCHLLHLYQHRPVKIGAFTACSNITGVQTPYHQMAEIMHEFGGICFVDFSASAPYVPIRMHTGREQEKLDGIFFSPHKFLGGPGTCGVAVLDSRLVTSTIPDHPGGGTVLWTNPWGGKKYVQCLEAREDGGTPGFVQAIRAAMCIQLKEQMGESAIAEREHEMSQLLLEGLSELPQLTVLEGARKDRLGIVSFYTESIHYNLWVRMLSDRFGIQVRGGCSCAGPYGHYLLHIDKAASLQMTNAIEAGNLSTKPGWVRISLHPIMTNAEIYAIIAAIHQILDHLDQWQRDYAYNPVTNDWHHRHQPEGLSETPSIFSPHSLK